MYEHGGLFATSSGKNLSGLNLYGFGQNFSSVWARNIPKTTDAPSGIMQSPSIKLYLEKLTITWGTIT